MKRQRIIQKNNCLGFVGRIRLGGQAPSRPDQLGAMERRTLAVEKPIARIPTAAIITIRLISNTPLCLCWIVFERTRILSWRAPSISLIEKSYLRPFRIGKPQY